MESTTSWWEPAVIYQIYPRSFLDSDGDGVGDLEGIRRRLDYLVELGIDAIWVSPIFPSPMADFGYDVSDYCGVDPLFGSLAAFDALVDEVHRRGLKIILDFVPNHTSDQHPWFVASRSGRDDPKRDWYVWRDAGDALAPPNNWVSQFGGPAWSFDDKTGQYYLHSFLPQQPDLNWRHPPVRAAMYDVLRFWLRRGVDGFRVDVLWLLIKDAAFRDNPANPHYLPGQPEINRLLSVYNADQPETQVVVSEMRAVLDAFADRVLIGEIYLPLERLVAYYGKHLDGTHLPFNFQLILTAWNARDVCRLIVEYERLLPPRGWPNWVLGNHDQSRIAARVGEAQARIAAMLLLTLRGTPTLYYGDELGIGRVDIDQAAMRDPWELREPGRGVSRDPARTPMPWTAQVNASFTAGMPWLPLNPDRVSRNVETMSADPSSILSLYRRLLALRKQHRCLHAGAIERVEYSGAVLHFERVSGDERIFVALNFGAAPAEVPVLWADDVTFVASTHPTRDHISFPLTLEADEGIMVKKG